MVSIVLIFKFTDFFLCPLHSIFRYIIVDSLLLLLLHCLVIDFIFINFSFLAVFLYFFVDILFLISFDRS